jgi:hypothetical protein
MQKIPKDDLANNGNNRDREQQDDQVIKQFVYNRVYLFHMSHDQLG